MRHPKIGLDNLDNAFKAIGRATVDRRHGFRTVILATASPDADARILILRNFDRAKRLIRLYTDHRSPKVASLQAQPKAKILLWNPTHKIQLRLSITASIQNQTDECQRLWKQLPDHGIGDYSSPTHPGSPLNPLFAQNLQPLEREEAFQHFSLIDCVFDEIDYLKLDRAGHQRWQFHWENEAWKALELIP
ncbi:MAG: pyridoxamine 5'-phosphate oxidase family protein [Bacteroidota bacterium]